MMFRFLTFFTLRDAYRSRHEPESVRALSAALWRATLAISFLCALSGLAYGIHGFTQALEAPTTAAGGAQEASGRAPAASRAAFDATLSAFDERAARLNALKAHPPDFSDPSR